MCGIAGFSGIRTAEALETMTARLLHRGPDDRNHLFLPEEKLSIGHTRLEILDREFGKQPMWSADRRVCVSYNGEIYNFVALRRQLSERGHKFVSHHSDTEVILHGYREWGRELPVHLNGMFAFVIYDAERHELFFARDRFGEKPLFWTTHPEGIIFASELPALMVHPLLRGRPIDPISIRKFLAHNLFPGETTPYKNVKKLEPGTWLTFNLRTKEIERRRYWSYQIQPSDPSPSAHQIDEWQEELKDLLGRSVADRLQSDVPLGVFLSGGIDSSAILSQMCLHRPPELIEAFTIGFRETSYDESEYAKVVAQEFGVIHNLKYVSSNEAQRQAPLLLRELGEPIGDSSILATTILSKFTRTKVKVALSGDGGDELFSGYDPFKAVLWARMYDTFVPSGVHQFLVYLAGRMPNTHTNMSFDFKVKRTLRGLCYPRPYWLPTWLGAISPDDLNDIFEEPMPIEQLFEEALCVWNRSRSDNLLDRMTEYFVAFYLAEGVLAKTDRASMRASLEVRAPFLDLNLAEFSCRIPAAVKFRNGSGKWLLKRSLEGIINDSVINRKKKGFGIPLADWILHLPRRGPQFHSIPKMSDWMENAFEEHRMRKGDFRHALWSYYSLVEATHLSD